jgi:hypothetical protein
MTIAVRALATFCALLASPHVVRAKDIGTDAPAEPGARTPHPTPQPMQAMPEIAPLPDAPVPPVETPAQSTFDVRRLAFEGHLGFGTPVGAIGGIVEYAPVPLLGLGAGAGYGSGPSNGSHFHGALLARLRLVRGPKDALVLGLAYSTGGYQRFHLNLGGEGSERSEGTWPEASWVHWAQADLGWERRTPQGFVIRLSLGAAVLLNPADLRCPSLSTSSCASTSETLVTFDLALGYAAIL